jgi:chromosome segregation protein
MDDHRARQEVNRRMRLSKITLSGFKSFAERTEFLFDEPVTGIVGPNGCGKSNVVDAIKWVLGERSAKSLRGDAMLDVIFAGSAARKAMGAATVTLTFDNPILDRPADERGPARLLGVDTEEVDVTRRLYRDGRSEYLINAKKCRLRDIKELFLDTGIGTNAYSIIEQGRVDAMLMANPIERRAIFEEAAGVAKFKVRKVEAQRKLEKSEVNLVRVREQLASTERRLRIVRRQAAKAKRFKELDARYRELRMAVTLDTYHELREQLIGLTSRIADLETQRNGLLEEVTQLEDEKQTAEAGRHELQLTERELEQRRLEYVAARKQAEQRRDIMQRNLNDARQHAVEDRDRLAELDARIDALQQQVDEAVKGIDAAATRVAEAEQRVADVTRRRADLQQSVVERRERFDHLREAIDRTEHEHGRTTARIESLEARSSELGAQGQRLTVRAAQIDRDRAECVHGIEEAETKHIAAQEEVDRIEAQLAEHDRAAAALGERQAELTELLADARHERAALESRLHLLEEMQQAREGLGDAVKSVLDDQERFPGVTGLVADVIDTERKYARLIETALGSDLHLLLVRETQDLARIRSQLTDLPGRAGFLVLDERPVNGSNGALRDLPGWVTPLLSVIRIQPHARAAIERLFVRTVLVWDLSAARMLAAGPLRGWRFITHAGELLDGDGRVYGGKAAAEQAGAGWLSRRLELGELRGRVLATDSRIVGHNAQLNDLITESAQQQQQLEASAEQLHDARRAVVEDQYQAQRLRTDLERFDRERALVQSEQRELQQRTGELDSEQHELESKREELEASLTAKQELFTTVEREFEEAQAEADEAQERLTSARLELSEVSSKHEAARRERRHLELTIEEATRQHEISTQQLHRRLSQSEQYEASIADAEEEIVNTGAALDEHAKRSTELADRLREAHEVVRQTAERLEGSRIRVSQLDRDYNAVELSRREAEIKRETLEERSLEEIELDLAEAYVPYRMQREEESFTPMDRDPAELEIDELRDMLRKLGNVNLDAIEEELQLEERNEELINQVEDIDTAVTQLQHVDRRTRTHEPNPVRGDVQHDPPALCGQ